MHRKCIPIDGNVLLQKALSRGIPWNSDIKPFTVGMVTQIQDGFRLKSIKITGEAVSADEEAAATVTTKLKKLIRVWYYPWFHASIGGLGRNLQRYEGMILF